MNRGKMSEESSTRVPWETGVAPGTFTVITRKITLTGADTLGEDGSPAQGDQVSSSSSRLDQMRQQHTVVAAVQREEEQKL